MCSSTFPPLKNDKISHVITFLCHSMYLSESITYPHNSRSSKSLHDVVQVSLPNSQSVKTSNTPIKIKQFLNHSGKRAFHVGSTIPNVNWRILCTNGKPSKILCKKMTKLLNRPSRHQTPARTCHSLGTVVSL